jgi:hypothetical protein
MRFDVEVKTDGERLDRGDLFYEKRRLYIVDRVSKPRGKKKTYTVMFRLIGKINLDRQRRKDRA